MLHIKLKTVSVANMEDTEHDANLSCECMPL